MYQSVVMVENSVQEAKVKLPSLESSQISLPAMPRARKQIVESDSVASFVRKLPI